jgi:hypothetical protein
MRIVTSAEPAVEPERSTLRFDGNTVPAANAPAPTPEERIVLERELDRVQNAVQAEQAVFGQQLNWLMLSQALFLNAYLLVLVVGWSTPLQGKRLLLGGLAVFAAIVAVLVYLALRSGRDALHALRAQRRQIETTLHSQHARTPVFQPVNIVTRGLGGFATRLLPASFIAGWVAISLYTLAAPISSKLIEDATAASAPAAAHSVRPAVRVPPANRSASSTGSGETATDSANAAAQSETAPPRRTGFKW